MRKAINDAVTVMVTTAAIPTAINAGIRRKLNHSERHVGAWKSMTVAIRTYKRIDVLRKILLGKSSLNEKEKKWKVDSFHGSRIVQTNIARGG